MYLLHGTDLYEGEKKTSGVGRIASYVSRHGQLHAGPLPEPGDLVFFQNTQDANGDGFNNDGWTHVGIVEQVDGDGTVVFISTVSTGIERRRLNLLQPHRHRSRDGKTLNDFLRRKRVGDPPRTAYLTGELFASYGRLAPPSH